MTRGSVLLKRAQPVGARISCEIKMKQLCLPAPRGYATCVSASSVEQAIPLGGAALQQPPRECIPLTERLSAVHSTKLLMVSLLVFLVAVLLGTSQSASHRIAAICDPRSKQPRHTEQIFFGYKWLMLAWRIYVFSSSSITSYLRLVQSGVRRWFFRLFFACPWRSAETNYDVIW